MFYFTQTQLIHLTPDAPYNLTVSLKTSARGSVYNSLELCERYMHAAGARSHSVSQVNPHEFYPYTKTLTLSCTLLATEIIFVYILKFEEYYFLLLRNTDKYRLFRECHPSESS